MLKENGAFEYLPKQDFTGTVTFTYQAKLATTTASGALTAADPTDPNNQRLDIATVTIHVHDVNPPVYAYDDFYRVLMNGELGVAAPGVLTNDSLRPPILPLAAGTVAATGDANVPGEQPNPFPVKLTAKLLTEPANGRISFNADGSFKYAPKEGFFGTDTFTYQALASLTAASDPATRAALNSTLTIAGAPCEVFPDGTILCLPFPNVDDIATVTIHVQQPEPPPGPVARDDSYVTAANTALGIRAPGVLANDYIRWPEPVPAAGVNSLPAGSPSIYHPLTAVLVDKPAHGTLTLNADGSFQYEPDPNFSGLDKFTYRASLEIPGTNTLAPLDPVSGDLLPVLSNIAAVTIRVVPAIAHDDEYRIEANAQLEIPAPGVLRNDSGGSDEHPLSAVLLTGPLHGRLELNATGGFIYKPAANFTGTDLFTYRATSDLASADPALASLTTVVDSSDGTIRPIPSNERGVAIVRIHVRAAASTVQAYNDRYATPPNVALEVPAPGVFANDYALVNHHITASIGDAPTHGTVTVNADGSFSYKPNENFVGEDKFTYKATDDDAASTPGTVNFSYATVVIHVLAANTLPRFISGGNLSTTDESGEQRIAEWATLLDAGSTGRPTYVVHADKPHLFAVPPTIDAAGQLVYKPAPNVSGQAQLTVSLHDGAAAQASATAAFTIQIDKPHPLYNTAQPCDVTGDNHVAPIDALVVINYLNARGATAAELAEGEDPVLLYYDVNKDDFIAAIDALLIINFLNAGGDGIIAADDMPEGEAAATDLSLLALVAQDPLDAATKRKRAN